MTTPAPTGRSAEDHSRPAARRSPAPLLAAVILAALTIYAFAPALDNDFVNWDDPANFLTNEHYRGLGFAELRWAWTTFHMGAYEPLAWMVTSIEYAWWGLDPRGFHAVSIALHAATAVLLFALTLAILRRAGVQSEHATVGLAAVAAGWYAVHPLRVEVVAWATAQANLLCGLFFVAAIFAYLQAAGGGEARHTRWLRVSLLLFLASLLSKAPSVGLPLVLLVLDVYPLCRIRGGAEFRPTLVAAVREKIWFFVLGAAFSIVALAAKAQTFIGVINQPSLGSRFGNAAYSGWFYLGKMIAPVDLAVYYGLPGPLEWRRTILIVSLISAVAACAGVLLWRRRLPAAAAVFAAFLALLAPVSGFVSISTQLVADRHAHLISMPLALALAGTLLWLRRIGNRAVTTAALTSLGVAGLVALTMSTRELCRTWLDSEALWTHALSHDAGRTMMAYNNLAAVHFSRADANRGIALLRTALARPADPAEINGRLLAHFNLAGALERRGRFGDAAEQYQAMASLAPVSGDIHYRWAEALAAQDKLVEAITHYSEALRLEPTHPRARAALEVARRRRGAG